MNNYSVQRYLLAISVGLVVSILSAGVLAPVHAAPLTELTYTGQLTASDGTAITEPTAIRFALYTVSGGGTPLWTGACGVLTPGSDGVISQPLDACAALPADLDSENLYYLGVTVGDNAEATPRVPLAPQAVSSLASQVSALQQAAAEATPILSPSPTATDEGGLGVVDDFETGGDAYVGSNLVVGAATSVSETLENSNFALAGNDLFVAGDAGVEGTLYVDGAFVVGATTTYDDGSIGSRGAFLINTDSNQTVTFGTGLVTMGGGLQVTGDIDVQDTNIVNVGDIALGTISSDDGGSVQVVLSDGDGDDFIVNTNVLVVESDTDRVGIGTTNPSVKLDVDGNLQLRGQNDLRFADSDSSNFVAFRAPGTVSSDITWTLPGADGTASQILSTDGSGTLSWSSAASAVGDDSLDFDKFGDTLDLDAATEINLGVNELAIDLDSTGDFVIKDAGTAFVTFADDGSITFANGLTVGTATTYDDGSITTTTGDSLSVVLGGAAGDDFIVDTNILVVESDNNRVGIGITTPQGSLHINNTVGNQAGIKFTDPDTGTAAGDGFDIGLDVSEDGFLWNNESQDIYFGTNGAERLRIDSSGNVGIGTDTFGTSAAGVLGMANATAPTTSPANLVQVYAEDVSASSELRVRDEAGNVTTLSPHNFTLIPGGPSEELAWSFYSERNGQAINVDLLKVVRLVESVADEQLVFIKDLATGEYEPRVVEEELLAQAELTEVEKANYRLWQLIDEVVFTARVQFAAAVEFISDVTFGGRVIFADKDMAGFAVIKAGAREVTITFEREFATKPVVTVNLESEHYREYSLTDVSSTGFRIKLAEAADRDLTWHWTALAVVEATTFESEWVESAEDQPAEEPEVSQAQHIETEESTNNDEGAVAVAEVGASDEAGNEDNEAEPVASEVVAVEKPSEEGVSETAEILDHEGDLEFAS